MANFENALDRRSMLKLAGATMVTIVSGRLSFAQGIEAEKKTAISNSLAAKLSQDMPKFDGVFSVDEAVCNTMASDFGHYVRNLPIGVLFPKSHKDVQKMVRYANGHKIKLAFRGTGGAAYGQSQVANGIVIDSSTLNSMSWCSDDQVDLQPGALWSDVVPFTLSKQMMPPVLPDTLFITAGGTLNAGGIGETSYRLGAQVDHVVEIDVVTGSGEFITCSKDSNSDLYQMILSGMGQCGIITRARVQLLPAPMNVAVRVFTYSDPGAFLRDLTLVAQNEPAGAIASDINAVSAGGWSYVMTVTTWLSGSDLDDPSWLPSMSGILSSKPTVETYSSYANRFTASYLAGVASGGLWIPHMYMAFFMPASQTLSMVNYLVNTPTATLGATTLVCMPMLKVNCNQTLLALPNEDIIFHMRIYRKAAQVGSPQQQQMYTLNHDTILPMVLAAGGTVYLPFSPLLSVEQRVLHYGADRYSAFAQAKQNFDPNNILTPGAGLFDA